jgi:hypothetical protein
MKNKILVVVIVALILASGLIGWQYLSRPTEPPFPAFQVTKSSSWITDPITLYDLFPFNVTCIKLPDNRIVMDRKEGWTANNFVAFGMLKDENNTLFFHPSINMGGSYGVRLVFNGEKIYRYLPGHPYYDESGKYFPCPTIHTNPENRIVTAMAYDEKDRTWYVKIIDTQTQKEIFYVKGKSRGVPLWLGKPEGPYNAHGLAGIKEGWFHIDGFGGFLDFTEVMEGRYYDLKTQKTYHFTKGFFFFDREYHRLAPVGPIKIKDGKIVDGLEFNAMSFHKLEGEDIEFIFLMAINPLPEKLKRKFDFPEFERTGRINFHDRGESYRLDDYEFTTDGKLQPDLYYLRGDLTDENGKVVGSLNLTAQAFDFWGKGGRENWLVGRAWWDPEVKTAWGRSFVKWKGTITLNDEIIEVENVPGFGEFMRIFPRPTKDVIHIPISKVKVAVLYATVVDRIREPKEIAKIIEDLKADLLFRGFFRWRGMAIAEQKHPVYQYLANAISEIKKENQELIFVGALAAQELNRVEYDPFNKKVISEEKVWEMALDPQKYGINLSKEELHEKYWNWTKDENYIFPDILNPDFQKLFLNFAKAQIDAGVDAIWIDGFFWQAKFFIKQTKNPSHPFVEEVFNATKNIVEEIHRYGLSKGKQIYVSSWSPASFLKIGIPKDHLPALDFVSISPSPEEIKNKKLNETAWKEKIKLTKQIYGDDIVIIAFIDWAFTADTPLGVFSQVLNKEEQREALINFDKFFKENGILFAYPVHGGFMGRNATILAFGKYYKYDSLAPEFETCNTIKELAQGRKE